MFHIVCSWQVRGVDFAHTSKRYTVASEAWAAYHREVDQDHSGPHKTDGGKLVVGQIADLQIDLVRTELSWVEGRATARGSDEIAESWTPEHGYRSTREGFPVSDTVAKQRVASLKSMLLGIHKDGESIDRCRCGKVADRYDPEGKPYCNDHPPADQPAPVPASTGLF